MKERKRFAPAAEQPNEPETLGPELEPTLGNFRASVHAWSEAMYNRPRVVRKVAAHRPWRLAAGWALSGILAAGAVSGGVYERHHQQELARIAAARESARQQQLAAERAREEEDLLAKVDSDVSREVPSAMEPLASLMAEDETK